MIVLLEMVDGEPVSLRLYPNRPEADRVMDACIEENLSHEIEDFSHELHGTIRMAGDDGYSVQMISRTFEEGKP